MIRRTFLACAAVGLAGYSLWPDRGGFDYSWLSADISATPLKELAGSRIHATGYVLPHSMARADFFILSDRRSLVCPHCQPSPSGLATLVVYPRSGASVANGSWEGTLDIGAKLDPETGYLSLARLYDAERRHA